jgi:hypothetical protein
MQCNWYASSNVIQNTGVSRYAGEQSMSTCKVKNKLSLLNLYFYPICLVLYSLRHVFIGADLWDTGYNYSNFQFMNMDYMDEMWLFATYLANGAGHLLSVLPGGNTMIGMNIYTSLVTALISLTGYFFCMNKLKFSPFLTFAGEIIALSLCWSPSAVLYNYLTYGLFLWGSILLYQGLCRNNHRNLFFAGVLLGINMGVRFSNLPEIGMISVLWLFGFMKREKIRTIANKTFIFLAGFLAAIGLFVGYISLRYHLTDYITGISRLFAMTEEASDYSAPSMLLGMVWYYYENTYWSKRLVVVCLIFCFAIGLTMFLGRKERKSYRKALWLIKAVAVIAAFYGVWWLYDWRFFTLDYATYQSVLWPCVLFLTMVLGMAAVRICQSTVPIEEKCLSAVVILTILLSSLGSNNAIYSSMNNMFLVAPYGLWQLGKLWKWKREGDIRWFWQGASEALWPVKLLCVLSAGLLLVQSLGFGAVFVFAEASGVRHPDTPVKHNPVLSGMYAGPERAAVLSELSAFIYGHDLNGKECLLYGQIPALSFYMDMPPAINSWSDLPSYGYDVMQKDMGDLEREIEEGKEKPVVMLGKSAWERLSSEMDTDDIEGEFSGLTQEEKKWRLIQDFMIKYEYRLTFHNDAFAVWMSGENS